MSDTARPTLDPPSDDDSGDFTVTFLMTATPEAVERLEQTVADQQPKQD